MPIIKNSDINLLPNNRVGRSDFPYYYSYDGLTEKELALLVLKLLENLVHELTGLLLLLLLL